MSLDEDWDQSGSMAASKADAAEQYVTTARPNGRTLRDLIAEARVDQRRALLIVRQVLEALAAAHAVGEIHGHVTPENITVLPGLGDERVKLVGGGGIGTPTAAPRLGSPVYCAPESALGGIDARADIYSVGAVLFELLTGRPPFFADDASALRRLHTYAPVQTLSQRAPGVSFPEALEHVVARALAKKRDARYPSATDMIAELDPVLEAIEAAQETSPPVEPRRIPNDSLFVLAKDLMPQPEPATNAANELLVPANVERTVPVLPWPTRAGLALRRVLARVRPIAATLGLTKLGRRQQRILAGVAAALVLGLVIALVTCGGNGTKPNGPAVAQDPEALVAAQCERLGQTCGDNEKHVEKISAQCKQAAMKHVEKGCTDEALAVYSCYERELCGKGNPVWALDDLRVLADRQHTCVSERRARSVCGGN